MVGYVLDRFCYSIPLPVLLFTPLPPDLSHLSPFPIVNSLSSLLGPVAGCRAGEACHFAHDIPSVHEGDNDRRPGADTETAHSSPGLRSSDAQNGLTTHQDKTVFNVSRLPSQARRFIPPPVDSSRVVRKPIPKAQIEDPRQFQIQQLRRRFSPKESAESGGTAFRFTLVPSDPDFPFEMAGLDCLLHVPSSYNGEQSKKPELEVKNKEMARGFQINVERGFERLASQPPPRSLLDLMNALDKQLESLLLEEEAKTVTIVPNLANRGRSSSKTGTHAVAIAQNSVTQTRKLPEAYSHEQCRIASERRGNETRQLEARIGRLPLFSKSTDGIVYTIPVTPRRLLELPFPLQGLKTVKLFVPLLYPLQSCTIEFQEISRDATKDIKAAFERKMKESSETNLMGHMNYLAQNLYLFASGFENERDKKQRDEPDANAVADPNFPIEAQVSPQLSESAESHQVNIISRPPEWGPLDEQKGPSDSASDSDSDSDLSDSRDSDGESLNEEASGVPLPSDPMPSSVGPERGISLSFPDLELYNTELLELISLCITIKCERCKETKDVMNLKSTSCEPGFQARREVCKKCSTPLGINYRKQLMHSNSVRAGYLDLEGCRIVDILPSNFLPTCSGCSTTYPVPGLVSVRGESCTGICRGCHRKMSFKIPEVRLLLVSASSRADRAPVRTKVRENLGIVAGQELPRRGRCQHYGKSYRWFRFSCCSKVYACDKCHNEASDHSNEHANRMICGHCSREQNYRPEDCGICHASLIKKVSSGFWEGGKGTRDRNKMSRKGTSTVSPVLAETWLSLRIQMCLKLI